MIQAEQTDDASLDGALIAQWMAGDERAATAIVERHAGALARFAVRLGVEDDVDELVQDTFIRAFSALESLTVDDRRPNGGAKSTSMMDTPPRNTMHSMRWWRTRRRSGWPRRSVD